MEIFNEDLSKVDTDNVEICILANIDITLWQDGHYIFQKHTLLSCQSVPNDVKIYLDFCTVFGLKQLIESPTRITCSSSSIINHVLASFPDRVTQPGILNVGLSDHQLINCTRKITRIKIGGHKQIKFRSFKNYTIDGYEKALVEINFPEYENFDNVKNAYPNFLQKLMEAMDKNRRIKRNSQEWFDSEISEKLVIRDKLFKKYKKTRLHVDKEHVYKRFIKEHVIVRKISLQKGKKNFLNTSSKNVSVILTIYGKLLNYSDYLINPVDV